ncbi:MAG: nucleotide exchange factor GrpE [Clostridia bacterium]|nr:nucleotide exchange factor GrpE [Clostridia bacterium]
MKKDENKEIKQQKAEAEVDKEVELTIEQALTEENEKLIAENDKLTAENEKLSATCKRLQSSADKSDTYLNQLVAMKNDFESYKRRMKFNGEQAKKEGIEQVLTKLINIVDTFELAGKHLQGDNLKAFTMVQSQFEQVLTDFGVVKMDVMGQPFDPIKMNALSKMDRGEENTDKVVEVYKNGYELGEKVLRYAEVIVGA